MQLGSGLRKWTDEIDATCPRNFDGMMVAFIDGKGANDDV
jgi:hypothetical protein